MQGQGEDVKADLGRDFEMLQRLRSLETRVEMLTTWILLLFFAACCYGAAFLGMARAAGLPGVWK